MSSEDDARTPKVSVVVCTYNQRDLLPHALNSILAQKTDFKFEIILADDCSSDGTRDVCREYAYRYPDKIRALLNESNKGIVGNYYDAIEAASGEYIADLAGDDVWTDCEKLQRQVDILDSDSSIALTHAAWRYLLPDGRMERPKGFARPAGRCIIEGHKLLNSILAHKKEEVFIHLCTSMYRRDKVMELLDECSGLIRGPWLCEDFQLEALLASKGKIAYEPQEVLGYRVGHPSISSIEDTAKNARFSVNILRLTDELAKYLNKDTPEIHDYFLKDFQYAAMNAFRSGDKESAEMVKQLAEEKRWEGNTPFALAAMTLMKNPILWKATREVWKRIKK